MRSQPSSSRKKTRTSPTTSIEQLKAGVEAIKLIVAVQRERIEKQKRYQAEKDELAAKRQLLSVVEESEEPAPE